MKKLPLVILAAFVLGTTAPAAVAKMNWVKVESKNFVLVGDASEQDTKEFAAKLEQFRLSLNTLFPGLKIETAATRVYVFRDNGSFAPFKPIYDGKRRDNVGGFFIGLPGMNYIALSTDPSWRYPLRPVFHEFEHSILRNNLGYLPMWLSEGLAEFFSTFYTSAGGKKATIGDPISSHSELFRLNSIWTFARLFAVDRGSRDYNESNRVGLFYAESWALVHFLMFQDVKNKTNNFPKFIELLSTEPSAEAAFQKAFGRETREVEAQLRDYVKGPSFPVMDVEFNEQIIAPKDLISSKVSEAESEYYAGDLLLTMFRPEDAEPHLMRSVALDDQLADAHLGLGTLRMNQKRVNEAQREYQMAIKLDPRNYRSKLAYGISLAADNKWDEALAALKAALVLKPDSANVHIAVARYWQTLGKDEQAISEISLATRLEPRNAEHYRALAFSLLRVGRGKFAVQAAQKYIQLSSWDGFYSGYMVMVAALGFQQASQPADAAAILKLASGRLPSDNWLQPIYKYLMTDITAAELLALANDNEKLTDAHSFLGMQLALTGKPAEARSHFEWVVAKGRHNSLAFFLATDELRRMTVTTQLTEKKTSD
ncbi:MAG: tetratricopeptide repeat protein [Pyrinomonadaceae bacterium]